MDDRLLTEVLGRLDAAEDLDQDAALLVLAACTGENDLETALQGEDVARPEPPAEDEPAEPTGAYLAGVTVEGFRGVGPAATLPLQPGPGLTLVVGRNGSGKSSFAEAVEFLLTGDSLRWADRSKTWREGWRNLHRPHPARITVDLAEEHVPGGARIHGEWAADADLGGASSWVQRHGQPRESLNTLGWEEPLVAFRPFLSYNELGSMLDEGPSKLYDALQAILGLDELTAAEKRLADARLTRTKRTREVKAALEPLLGKLDQVDDARAQACREALARRRWDLEAVERILSDTADAAGTGSELDLLRTLTALTPPNAGVAAAVVESLREAARRSREVEGTDAAEADRLALLLDQALAYHEHHGDGDCPVCGRVGALDGRWRDQAAASAETLRARARAVDEARTLAGAARRRAGELLQPVPRPLEETALPGLGTEEAREQWQQWYSGAPARDLAAVAEHIETSLPMLGEAVDRVRKAARAEFERRQDEWRPLALELSGWLADAIDAQVGEEAVPRLRQAEQWLKATAGDLRDERFQPIASHSIRLWQLLRQHSNVELGRVVLEGSGTRRRVALEVTVDGVEGAALGVMSQGELHALALSLFLPRATLPESAFRFLVIDDPVQSMDPARVDGLARVLDEVARTRQVVVFTHDGRLAEAVRRLQIDARVLEVTRRPGSVVEVREVSDPVARHLDDARALVLTGDLPDEIVARVVPGFCRLAIEAACDEAYRRRRLGAGDSHAEVEAALEAAARSTVRAALALFGDAERGGDVLNRLNQISHRGADTFKAVQRGVHDGHRRSLQTLVDDSAELARNIRRQ